MTLRTEEPTSDLPREAYSLLAQANLLRMRGCWPEAIERCMAALRLAPEHPSAQSLLGDIYENQGLLDDAIQWYRMALDVQPDSPADRLKLTRLLAVKASSLAPLSPTKPEPTVAPAPLTLFLRRFATQRQMDPDRLLRRVASVAGAAALLVILLALALAHGGGSLAFGGAKLRPVNVPTVVVPAFETAAPQPPPPGAALTMPAGDPVEQGLLTTLQNTPALAAQGVTAVGVQTDPRMGRLTLTLSCQPSPTTRDQILREATRALQAAAQNVDAPQFPQFTVRCLLASSNGGSTPLVFTADISHAGVVALNPNLSALPTEQIAAAYTDLWWSPAVAAQP